MSAVADMSAALAAALGTVAGLSVYTDPGVSADPPAVLIGPPSLTWDGYVSAPTDARYELILMVAADERANERLWDLLPQVAAAVDTVQDAVVRSAEPGAWTTGTTELPCYRITVETSL